VFSGRAALPQNRRRCLRTGAKKGKAPVPHATDMQRLGEALAASRRVDGLKYESVARPGNPCLAIFEANAVALGSSVAVNDRPNGLADHL
jgi:hypothetical protein